MKSKSLQLVKALIISAMLVVIGNALPSALGAETTTIKGEVVDLMCYLDHGAKGDKHATCAKTCITSGGPVGILTEDDKLYLIIGDHKPLNDKLAPFAGKTISIKGQVVERNGIKMIQKAEIES